MNYYAASNYAKMLLPPQVIIPITYPYQYTSLWSSRSGVQYPRSWRHTRHAKDTMNDLDLKLIFFKFFLPPRVERTVVCRKKKPYRSNRGAVRLLFFEVRLGYVGGGHRVRPCPACSRFPPLSPRKKSKITNKYRVSKRRRCPCEVHRTGFTVWFFFFFETPRETATGPAIVVLFFLCGIVGGRR